MPGSEPFDNLPLLGVFAATMGLALIAVVAGYLLGNRLGIGEKKQGPVGELVGAMLTLASLLLAFTFGWAQSHYDARRDLVLNEANAIGTTWLRARMVPEPQRSEVRNLLREYVEVRVGAVQTDRAQQGQQLQQAIAKSEELHNQLWDQAGIVSDKDRSDIAALFVDSLNQVIDLHAKRVHFGLRTRIAFNIWGALYLITFLSLGLMGYHAGLGGARPFFTMTLVVLTFSIVLILIADLDRPYEGMLKTSQQSLIELRKLMNGPT